MRLAKAGDHWRNLYQKTKSFQIKVNKLQYNNLLGIGSGIIEFNGGITAICGANGVGKTTLLKAVLTTLVSDGQDNKATTLKLDGAELIGEFVNGNNQILRMIKIKEGAVEANPKGLEMESLWIDVPLHAPQMISIFSEMPNIQEMLDSEEPRLADEEELKLLSYIVGKQYDACRTFELELEHYGTIPYFEVEANGTVYASETMGLGEIAVHFILWNMRRISKNSIVLMEEPETYLAPKSQEALLDVIAKMSHEKRIWVILTTHSPGILKSIPMEHIRLLTRIGDSVEITIPTGQADCLQTLGIKVQKAGIILVEDRAAREYTKCWLGRFSPSLLQEFEIKDVASKENIILQLRSFPKVGSWFKIFGLFDGDQRGVIKGEYNWSFSFLPGIEPPEKQFMQLAKNKRNELATLTGRDITRINRAIASLEGRDHHDWLIEFPQLIGVGYDQLISYFFELSMTDENIKNSIEDAYQELINALYA